MRNLKLKKPPYKRVFIKWDDAVGNSRWFDRNEAESWLNTSQWIIQETGFLIAENKHAIYLCAFWKPADDWTEEQFGGLRRIPKNWIL